MSTDESFPNKRKADRALLMMAGKSRLIPGIILLLLGAGLVVVSSRVLAAFLLDVVVRTIRPVLHNHPGELPNEAVGLSFEYSISGSAVDEFMTMGINSSNEYTMGAKFLDEGAWNGTPVIPVSDLRNQEVDLVFALNGVSAPPAGTMSVRKQPVLHPVASAVEPGEERQHAGRITPAICQLDDWDFDGIDAGRAWAVVAQ